MSRVEDEASAIVLHLGPVRPYIPGPHDARAGAGGALGAMGSRTGMLPELEDTLVGPHRVKPTTPISGRRPPYDGLLSAKPRHIRAKRITGWLAASWAKVQGAAPAARHPRARRR